jgi:hypothetical protein
MASAVNLCAPVWGAHFVIRRTSSGIRSTLMPKILKNKSSNKSLQKAKDVKNDEFYTRYDDIQTELNFYKDQLKGKVIYCNCDDPAESAFTDFFKLNFDYLGIKKLICTRYQKSNLFLVADPVRRTGYRLEITAENKDDKKPVKIDLEGDGDFRSSECIEFLKQSDIVITNPPFSLFREYVAQLLEYNKKFLIIGSDNCRTYKEIFKLIKGNKIWCGYTRAKEFGQPDGTFKKFGNVGWYTNLDVKKRREELILFETYKGNEEKYPKYDNYEAIEVSKLKNMPKDYKGVMGVPINYLDVHNPKQFEIVGSNRGVDQDPQGVYGRGAILNGKEVFKRLFIKNKKLKK